MGIESYYWDFGQKTLVPLADENPSLWGLKVCPTLLSHEFNKPLQMRIPAYGD